jgi:hypothetical protein
VSETITGGELVELDEHTAALAWRLREIQDSQSRLNDEAEHIKATLRGRLRPGQTGLNGGAPVVKIQATRSFDLDAAAGLLTDEQRQLCVVELLDAKKVKAQLPAVLVESCMKATGKPKVIPL